MINSSVKFDGQNYTPEEMIHAFELVARSLKHAISNLTAGVDPNDKRNVKLLASTIVNRMVEIAEEEINKFEVISTINGLFEEDNDEKIKNKIMMN